MASADVASNLPAAAVPYGWLGPRVSFSHDGTAAAADAEPAVSSSLSPELGDDVTVVSTTTTVTPEPAISKDFIDFEFSLGGSATMLPADELFADGKLLPLRKSAPLPADPPPARAEASTIMPVKPLRAAAVVVAAADGTDPYAFSPKAPSCSSRWRELLGLRRTAAAQSPMPSSPMAAATAPKTSARATNSSSAARSLKLLLHYRNNGRSSGAAASSDLSSAPLLRDSSDSEASLSLASSRFSLSSSSSSSGRDSSCHDDIPRASLDSADPNPPRIRLVRSSHQSHQQPHRHSCSSSSSARAGRSPSPPPPPRCLSVDSPRMNSSGKIVFHQGLERSSSSPCSLHAASKSRARAVDRSYSSGVRVAPVVLNVPMCSRPVFGFFKDKKQDPTAAARSRSSLGRKTTPQAWSGELPRSSG